MKALLALVLLAGPALADPIDARGYATGCDDLTCTIVASGFILTVDPASDRLTLDLLHKLDPVTAVSFHGDLGEMGDITALVTLSSLKVEADDPYQDQLRAVQGLWTDTVDKEVEIHGLEWTEMQDGTAGDSFLISPGGACADGPKVQTMALSLYREGGAPEEAACWQVDKVTDLGMTLHDARGDQGPVSWMRKRE